MNFGFSNIKADYLNNSDFNEQINSELEELIDEAKHILPKLNEKLIRKAFYTCILVHQNQLRLSGEPYYKHPLAVARIVMREIKVDDIAIVCALLHDVLSHQNKITYDEIKAEFGTTVADIVESIHKIKNIEAVAIDQIEHLENYRRLLFSLFKDVRIILIKLAERLNNMRTLDYVSADKQLKSAQETMEVYVPFASRFGLFNIKWELEDLAFKYLNRKAYDEIKTNLMETRQEREDYVKNFAEPIKEKLKNDKFLKSQNITFEISGRAKHIYSIYNKMILRQKPMDELYDLVAVRLIIDSDDPNMCFYVYGMIASIYPPVPETFKDYISATKQNGYQSIHTAVLGPKKKPVEVQIRTRKMHEVSEHGVAAHFKYKSGLVPATSVLNNSHAQEWMDSVREILESESSESPQELLESVKRNMFLDEIHIFTPANQLFTFPKGSTPLDFAFAIHTELGFKCIGAKVNGKIVPLDYKLVSGDQVEILTSNSQNPKKEWLSLVGTSRSKNIINRYLKTEEKRIAEIGEELWKNECAKRKIAINEKSIERLALALNYSSTHKFYFDIANKALNIEDALKFFKYKQNWSSEISESKSLKRNKVLKQKLSKSFNNNALNIVSSEILIKGDDRPQMINDITNRIIELGNASLFGVSFDTYESKFEGKISISAPNKDYIHNLCESLHNIKGIKSIQHFEI